MVLKLSATLFCIGCRKAERKNQTCNKTQDVHFHRTVYCDSTNGVCSTGSDALPKTERLKMRLQYAKHQYNIHLNSVLHRMYSCSFSDRCPLSLMPYYSTAWGSSVFMFKRDFPSSFGEVLLTLHKLCDIRW